MNVTAIGPVVGSKPGMLGKRRGIGRTVAFLGSFGILHVTDFPCFPDTMHQGLVEVYPRWAQSFSDAMGASRSIAVRCLAEAVRELQGRMHGMQWRFCQATQDGMMA